jgi:long-chain acyl-CoA synthetase
MDKSALNENLRTPLDNFYHWEKTTPNHMFLRQPKGNEWKTFTYAEVGGMARKMVSALRSLGLEKGDHIGILSKNCYHWIVCDIALMMGGYVSVPFYASTPKLQLKEVVDKSDIKALFIGKLDDWGDRGEALHNELKVIRFPHYEGNAKVDIGLDWDELLNSHEPVSEDYRPQLDDLWTILFTSGTTGSPKGVMHSYRAPALIIRGEELTNFIGIFKVSNQKYLSYLPLNHVGERIGVEINCIATGGTMSFGESIDTFAKNLQDVQPTMFFSVPRIWTKFYQGVLARLPEKKLNLLMKIPVISGIVKGKIKYGLGMRDAKIVATGAAITPKHIKEWFNKFDIHLIESYGMTEACGSISNGVDRNTPYDSVGRIVPFCEVKIDSETGEILMKTPHMMLGYYKEPDKTAEVIRDGWIHSGDKGELDKNGFLKLVGRVNDTFKTAKGKFIVPNPIEEKLSMNTYIEQVCLAGMTSPQPVALVNLSEEGLKTEASVIEKSLSETLEVVNKELAAHEKVSTIIITKDLWSENNQLLTPTLKVKRSKIDEKYQDYYLSWHESKPNVVWESKISSKVSVA